VTGESPVLCVDDGSRAGPSGVESAPDRVHRTPGSIARAAVRALYIEVALEPKPGLVSFRDTGSHADMDGSTFLRSLFALRGYFRDQARSGADGADFESLRQRGVSAEARMLQATGGVNTHRGAIFTLGLLSAAAGAASAAQCRDLTAQRLRSILRQRWGPALHAHARAARLLPPRSHGQAAARQHGLRSAADEAALGLPLVFDVALPALQRARDRGAPSRAARLQSLMATMAVMDDTNLVHRGGIGALRDVQALAVRFLASGGVHREGWVNEARHIHRLLVQRRLSPGGAADMLACAVFVDLLQAEGRAGR